LSLLTASFCGRVCLAIVAFGAIEVMRCALIIDHIAKRAVATTPALTRGFAAAYTQFWERACSRRA